ncbi:MAG: hypothetical protein IJT41_06020 [Clostridia bacterium]|nr:hypothetical protein [Clostridia bacterium]
MGKQSYNHPQRSALQFVTEGVTPPLPPSEKQFAVHGFLWDKMKLSLIVIASAFMARGNPFSFLYICALPGLRIATSLRSSR